MSDRLHFWFGYVGSAALIAFLATCLEAPRVATYACDTPTDRAAARCELVDTLAAATAPAEVAAARHDAAGDSSHLAIAVNAVN